MSLHLHATPNDAIQFGNIQNGNTTAYYVSGRLMATIQWLTGTPPTSLSFKYWSGVTPPGSIGTNFESGYFDISATGGSSLYL